MSLAELVALVKATTAKHVVVTGGEPMIMPDIAELCSLLAASSYHITIETAATVFTPVHCDLASLSPKLANSTPWQRDGKWAVRHEASRLNVPVIAQFIRQAKQSESDFQLKFVVAQESDMAEIGRVLAAVETELGQAIRPDDVLLMPEGIDAGTLNQRAGWVGEICKQTGYRFCQRLHVQMYGHVRGT